MLAGITPIPVPGRPRGNSICGVPGGIGRPSAWYSASLNFAHPPRTTGVTDADLVIGRTGSRATSVPETSNAAIAAKNVALCDMSVIP
jgi:hypothetical protein